MAVSQRTREEPSGEDEAQVNSEEAARPRGFTWKCLSCRIQLLQLPDNIRSSVVARAGMTVTVKSESQDAPTVSRNPPSQATGMSGSSVLLSATTAEKPDKTREVCSSRKPQGDTFVSMTHSYFSRDNVVVFLILLWKAMSGRFHLL